MALYARMEKNTRKWWFYLVILLVQFLPPYPIGGITSSRDFSRLVEKILSHALVLSWRSFYPVFKVVPLVLLCLLIVSPASRPFFRLFVALHYFILAFLQNAALLPDQGFSMITSNVVMVTLVALSFLGEFFARKTSFSFGRFNWKKGFLIGMAIFAFLYPVDPVSLQPRFHIGDVFANVSGLTFCMMTPFYLVVLLLGYPEVNMVTLRVAGLVGAIIGGYNVYLNFIFDLSRL